MGGVAGGCSGCRLLLDFASTSPSPGLLPQLRYLVHEALRAVPLGAPLFLCCVYYTHS